MIAGLLTEQKVADVDHLRWDLRQVFDMVVAYRAEPCSLAVHAKRSGEADPSCYEPEGGKSVSVLSYKGSG